MRSITVGDTIHETFLLRRMPGTEGGRFAFALEDVEDFDAGCNEVERTAGDRTCAGNLGVGELSDQLVVRSAWERPAR
jgi:hypothetical protein